MMEEWLAGLAAASLIPALAALGKVLISKALKSKTKQVVTTDEAGKTEVITVRATAGPSEIRDRIDEAYSFEAEIASALEKLQENNLMLKMHPARQVDFIVEMPKGRLALEVKLALDRVDTKAIERYLAAEKNLSHLLLVSRTQPSERMLEAIKTYAKERQVSLLTIPKGFDAGPLIESKVKQIAAESGGA